MPIFERAASRSQRRSDARIGVPVTVARRGGKCVIACAKVQPIRDAKRASTREARPGSASPVHRYTGTRNVRAARTTGIAIAPPDVSATFGRNRAIRVRKT